MADLQAPYFSGTELISLPGDAAMGGGQINFDPSNKAPLQGLQDAFTRANAENNSAIEAEKQRKHDMLMRHMQQEHEDKVRMWQQQMKDREQLFGMLNQQGQSTATLKDANGNDMSIGFLPEDQSQLNDQTNTLMKKVMGDPVNYKFSPEYLQQMSDLKQLRNNASMRTVYYKQAQQQLQNTYDPKERERIQNYLERFKEVPLTSKDMPYPFISQPTVRPLIDVEKEYKDGKGFEEFENGTGVPNARYLSYGATSDPQLMNEGFKRYQFFQSQPEGQDAQSYAAWKQRLDNLTEQRGLPQIDLPVTTTGDGKVVFDDGTYAKKRELARKMLAATELMNNGYLRSPSEEDVEKARKSKAEARKYEAEAAIKEKTLAGGVPQKMSAEERKEFRDKRLVESLHNDAQSAFNTSGKTPQTPQYPSWWDNNGIKTSEYNIYPEVPKDESRKFSGVMLPGGKRKSGDVTEDLPKSTEMPDKVVPIENKKTGEKRLVFIKDGKVIAKVNEKQAVQNALKHESRYDPKLYEKQLPWVEDLFENGAPKTSNAAVKTAAVKTKTIGGVTYERDASGKWYKVSG